MSKNEMIHEYWDEGLPIGTYQVRYWHLDRHGEAQLSRGCDNDVSEARVAKIACKPDEAAQAVCRSGPGGVTIYGSERMRLAMQELDEAHVRLNGIVERIVTEAEARIKALPPDKRPTWGRDLEGLLHAIARQELHGWAVHRSSELTDTSKATAWLRLLGTERATVLLSSGLHEADARRQGLIPLASWPARYMLGLLRRTSTKF